MQHLLALLFGKRYSSKMYVGRFVWHFGASVTSCGGGLHPPLVGVLVHILGSCTCGTNRRQPLNNWIIRVAGGFSSQSFDNEGLHPTLLGVIDQTIFICSPSRTSPCFLVSSTVRSQHTFLERQIHSPMKNTSRSYLHKNSVKLAINNLATATKGKRAQWNKRSYLGCCLFTAVYLGCELSEGPRCITVTTSSVDLAQTTATAAVLPCPINLKG